MFQCLSSQSADSMVAAVVHWVDPATASRSNQHDRGRFSSIAHRNQTACGTHTRTGWTMVGCQGRLDAGPLIGSAGRRPRGFVGSRLLASQGRRSGQRSVLVWSVREACLPRATGCGVAQDTGRPIGIERLVSALGQFGCFIVGALRWAERKLMAGGHFLSTSSRLHATPQLQFPASTPQALSVSELRRRSSYASAPK